MADYWSGFYNSVFGGAVGTLQKDQSQLSAGTGLSFGTSMEGLTIRQVQSIGVDAATGMPSASAATGSIITPSGKAVQETGSWFTDLMNSVVGVSPLAGDYYKDPQTGETVTPAETGGVANAVATDWQQWLARGSVIVLGLIFVAVGLALFGKPVVQEVKKAIA